MHSEIILTAPAARQAFRGRVGTYRREEADILGQTCTVDCNFWKIRTSPEAKPLARASRLRARGRYAGVFLG